MKIGNIIFLIAGICILIGAIFVGINTQSFIESATVANGKVINFNVKNSTDGTTYAPVVEFVTSEGEKIEFTSSVSSSSKGYSLGESITVLYEENKPYTAKINSFYTLWSATMILAVLGIIFSAIGVYTYLKYKKGKVEINLNSFTLKPGEEFIGTVDIKLFKNVDINSFIISIIGEEIISYRRRGRRRTETNEIYKNGIKPIYNKSLPAGHESSYNFNFAAPNPNEFVSLKYKTEPSFYEKIINFFRQEERKVEWYILAVIDAKGIDLDNRKQVFINNIQG